MQTTIQSKPFLKWAGGKAKLVPVLMPHLGEGERLVEPFVGSGAVFMGTDFPRYLLCDTNADLIGLFINLQQRTGELLTMTEQLFTPKYNTEDAYYALRDEFNSLPSDHLRKSALFVYLNKHGFNGLCRYNAAGRFNVPFGRYKAPVCPLPIMQLFAEKSERAEFKCLDFVDTFDEVQPGDVVYCDPPYVPLSDTANFTAYAADGFSLDHQRTLARCAMDAAAQGTRVVISNHDTPVSRELYQAAELAEVLVHRSISSKGATRGKAKELIAIFT